jgi:hypothetical protein
MAKDMKISIAADQVMFSNISRSKDGYNSARVVAKIADNEYMSVSYEWEGKEIPDFAMNLMGFMSANKMEIGPVEEHADEFAEFSAKKGKKGVNPFAKKDGEDDEDPKKDKKDPKKDDKKKDKKDDKKKKKEKSDEDESLEDE